MTFIEELSDAFPVFNDESTYKFEMGKGIVLKEGKDVTLITNGETLVETIDCATILSKDYGIDAEIINVPIVKPIDSETIIASASKTNLVFTIENHSIIGGLGSSVCEVLSEQHPTRVVRIGTNDEFGQSGSAKELMEHYGLNAEQLAKKIMKVMTSIH